MSVVHTYYLPQVIQLGTDGGAPNMNHPVNNTDIKLFRNVRNTVEIYIKDIDRKPVNLPSNVTPVMYITDRTTQEVKLVRSLSRADAAKGLYRLTVEAVDIDAWDVGYLNYMVVMRHLDTGHETLLFTDRGRTPNGVIEVVEGPIPRPKEAIRVLDSDLLRRGRRMYSGTFQGAAAVGNLSGVHTVAAYLANFTGKIIVQGSLDDSVTSDDTQWFDVTTAEFFETSGVKQITFEHNLVWVRFVVEREPSTEGKVDKFLYRN